MQTLWQDLRFAGRSVLDRATCCGWSSCRVMKLAVLGIALGLGMSFVLALLIDNLLFGITAYDPATFSVMCVVLIGVGLLACYLPARRALGVAPITALRIE